MTTSTGTSAQPIKDFSTFKTRVYIGFYHFRAAAPLSMVFEFDGDLSKAIERFKVHCDRCNYRFIKVRPFIVDLDEREARINNNEYSNQDGF